MKRKKIAVIATGGTIAGKGDPGDAAEYQAGQLPVESILETVPQLSDLADLEVVSVSQIDSNDITFDHYRKIKELCEAYDRDEETDGIVITHGTDTLEETSFLLNIILNVRKPVVITGAMRPATAASADGPMNLYQAVALAAAPNAEDLGVLAVFSNTIYSGRDIAKQNGAKVDAFRTSDFGILGYMRDEDVYLMQSPYRTHTWQSELNDIELNDMPKTEIFFAHQEADPALLSWMLDHYDGVVIAGTGTGNYSKEIQEVIAKNPDKIIVRSSRLPEGLVYPSEVFDPENLTIPSYRLSPQKSRMLLMCALKKYGRDKGKIRECFERY